MPGIVGLQTRMPRGWAEPQLKRMLDAMQHEHFYVTGTWIDETTGIYVGWIARKNSFSDGMPLRNDRGDRTLIFSGEEYPDPGLARHLHKNKTQQNPCASSYLMGFAETDPNFPACLNGRFHGLLADSARGGVILFNDRYGMHRLYYHQSTDAFYFAAEAKAILSVRPELRSIESRALGEYVTCGCVLENRTLFQGIQVLPCAAKWLIRNGRIEHRGAYFQPSEWETQEILPPQKYYQELRDVFGRILPRYFKASEQIGLSLTGGLDTRMILAWQKELPGSLPCYTFGGMYRNCQDVIVARQVARACEQPHEVIEVGHDFLSRFHRYAERTIYLTDGCADVCRASDLYANEHAREIAPIRMTGNYGSEVLRGVRAFGPAEPLPGLYSGELQSLFRRAKETYHAILQGNPVSFAVFKQAPWHHYGLLALEQMLVTIRSPYLDNDLVRTAFRAPQAAVSSDDVCLRLIADGDPVLRGIPTDRGIGRAGLLGDISRSMLKFSTKAEYAYDYGMPQWLARLDQYVLPLQLERLFLGRHRFTHYRIWFRDVLASYVREMLLDSRSLSRPYLEKKTVETIVSGHLTGGANYTSEIHSLLTLELLHRLFVDKN